MTVINMTADMRKALMDSPFQSSKCSRHSVLTQINFREDWQGSTLLDDGRGGKERGQAGGKDFQAGQPRLIQGSRKLWPTCLAQLIEEKKQYVDAGMIGDDSDH